MEAIFRLNTRELGSSFINSLKDAYPDQNIEITVREQDETDYLLGSPANREILEKSIQDAEQGRNTCYFDTVEAAIACAQSQTTK